MRFGLPVAYLDQLVWRPGWVMATREDIAEKMGEALAPPAWILDNALTRDWPRAVEAADLIIWLDYPTWLCLFRVLKRILSSWRQVRPDMADGCPEQWDLEFLVWIAGWRRSHRPKLLPLLEGRAKTLVFRRAKELETWLRTLP